MQLDLTRHIFTYGSLMSTAEVMAGEGERRQLAAAARLVGPGSVAGLLFDVGPYPAAVLTSTGQERIHGEIWRLPPRRAWLLDILDRYEGCAHGSPEPFAYVRRRVYVSDGSGRPVAVWMYLWNRPLGAMPRIAGGRWRGRREPVVAGPAFPVRVNGQAKTAAHPLT
jgi:gamma-glutamylcyclotransferase (GGCT)/AIG2-like uncharacterized protein YtfP